MLHNFGKILRFIQAPILNPSLSFPAMVSLFVSKLVALGQLNMRVRRNFSRGSKIFFYHGMKNGGNYLKTLKFAKVTNIDSQCQCY